VSARTKLKRSDSNTHALYRKVSKHLLHLLPSATVWMPVTYERSRCFSSVTICSIRKFLQINTLRIRSRWSRCLSNFFHLLAICL